MMTSKDQELKHLSVAIVIMLLPYNNIFAPDSDSNGLLRFEYLREGAASKEYWEAIGGVRTICEKFRFLFANVHGNDFDFMSQQSVYNPFPPVLDKLFDLLGQLPARGEEKVESALMEELKMTSMEAVDILRNLGDGKYIKTNDGNPNG